MRSQLIINLSLTVLMALVAGRGEAADAAPLKIAIEGEKVAINGTSFSVPFERAELEAVLGKPDRESDLTNLVLTWDQLGIVAYVIKKSGPPDKDGKSKPVATTKVRQLSIALDKEDGKFAPAKLFTGQLSIDGAAVTVKSAVSEVNAAKKGEPFKKYTGIPGWHTIEYEGSMVVMREASEKSEIKGAKVKSVSFDARLAKPAAKK